MDVVRGLVTQESLHEELHDVIHGGLQNLIKERMKGYRCRFSSCAQEMPSVTTLTHRDRARSLSRSPTSAWSDTFCGNVLRVDLTALKDATLKEVTSAHPFYARSLLQP